MSLDRICSGDDAVTLACDALSREDPAEASAVLRDAHARFPLDSRLHVLRSLLAAHAGRATDALQHLWHGLAAEPGALLCREAVLELVVPAHTPAQSLAKDFTLHSGERQTADTLDGIRWDHRERYAFAARWLRRRWPDLHLRCGLDAFAGNGYGSRLVADLTGARMVGIDGSADAMSHAERCFGDHRVVFGQAAFPFELRTGLFDFAVCFESIEHVDAPLALIQQIAAATNGPLLVSVPNESALSFARCGHRFEHHTRHFTREELEALMAQAGRPVVRAAFGQDVYRMHEGDIAGLLPEAQMTLHALHAHSQFIVMACDRD